MYIKEIKIRATSLTGVNQLVSMTETGGFCTTENIKIILDFLNCYFYSVAVFAWANAKNPQSQTEKKKKKKNYSHNQQAKGQTNRLK